MPRITTLAVLLAAACACTATSSTPTEVGELYAALNKLPNPTLGCLSQANFDTVHHLIPKGTLPIIYEDVAHVMAAVQNGTVDAGLLSGTPPAQDGVSSFTSTLISPRAMLTCASNECDTLLEAVDAAIVRALHNASDVAAARAHAPFDYLSVHTCKTNEPDARFPFPTPVEGDRLHTAIKRGMLNIGALGPYDWGNSGNYSASPPIGFWPDFYDSVETYFQEGVGIPFKRVWATSSDDVMAAVENGDADVTEPYFVIDSYYKERARQHMFDVSCTTIGYDSTFIVKDALTVDASATDAAHETTVVVAVVGAVIAVAAFLFVLYIRRRERGGAPLWTSVEGH